MNRAGPPSLGARAGIKGRSHPSLSHCPRGEKSCLVPTKKEETGKWSVLHTRGKAARPRIAKRGDEELPTLTEESKIKSLLAGKPPKKSGVESHPLFNSGPKSKWEHPSPREDELAQHLQHLPTRGDNQTLFTCAHQARTGRPAMERKGGVRVLPDSIPDSIIEREGRRVDPVRGRKNALVAREKRKKPCQSFSSGRWGERGRGFPEQ